MARAKAVPPEIGVQDVIFAITPPDLEGMTGKYFVEGREAQSSSESYDLDSQPALVGDQRETGRSDILLIIFDSSMNSLPRF
jgi:hypothetical protein